MMQRARSGADIWHHQIPHHSRLLCAINHRSRLIKFFFNMDKSLAMPLIASGVELLLLLLSARSLPSGANCCTAASVLCSCNPTCRKIRISPEERYSKRVPLKPKNHLCFPAVFVFQRPPHPGLLPQHRDEQPSSPCWSCTRA